MNIDQHWEPVQGHILTRWANDVDPQHPLPEYPRPQMVRTDWHNLNGLWDYAVRPLDSREMGAAQGQILVPFPLEAALSGVKRVLKPDERLWYRRRFSLPEEWRRGKVLLHFGAVDWEARLWVNGTEVGLHRGGYEPFSMDISTYLRDQGENELVVAVWDPSDAGRQECGKQTLRPHEVFYTPTSGIWQTVWLEPVPMNYIQGLKLTPDIDRQELALTANVEGDPKNLRVAISVLDGGVKVTSVEGETGQTITLPIPSPKLWSPDSPHLYDLKVRLFRGDDELDGVESYFGMRKFSLGKDEHGTPRLMLNNQALFQFGPLDQGYWPDGNYTAPTDEALRFDIEAAKQLGCNMIRKHIKVEPARWYYHCDRLGMIVWQDMPNGGMLPPPWQMFIHLLGLDLRGSDRHYQRMGRQDPAVRENYRRELKAMIDGLYNAPCIGLWVPFNETWGQFDAAETAEWLREYDFTRPVDHASGWLDQGRGDLVSRHIYVRKLVLAPSEKLRAQAITEFGGYGLYLPEHSWQTTGLFSYKLSKTSQELTAKYVDLIEKQVRPLIVRGLSAVVYTQTTDVEGEINGYLTYDRAVMKMDVEQVSAVNRSLYEE